MKVVIINDMNDSSKWEEHFGVENITDFIQNKFKEWPSGARIYKGNVSEETDITPKCEADIEILRNVDGTIFIALLPAVSIIVTVVIAIVATLVTAYLLRPDKIEESSAADTYSLAKRRNKLRPGERIPDIFGTVRTVPDLAGSTYVRFEKHTEIEYSLMCVGRGTYDIDMASLRDGNTLMMSVPDASIEFYNPGDVPYHDTPFESLGSAITEYLLNTTEIKSANNQVLEAPNEIGVFGDTSTDDKIYFDNYNEVHLDAASTIDFRDYFSNGDIIRINDAPSPGFLIPSLDGSGYTISTVAEHVIVLSSPETINSAWALLSSPTENSSAYIETDALRPTDWFYLQSTDAVNIISNVIAQSGLYRIRNSDGKQRAMSVDYRIESQAIDSNNNPSGSIYSNDFTIAGSNSKRSLIASSTDTGVDALAGWPCRIRFTRLTYHDTNDQDTKVDEIRLHSLYLYTYIDASHDFGDVTLIYSRLPARKVSAGLEGELNVKVTRKLPTRISGSTFSTTLTATPYVSNILSFMCLDPYIGNRSVDEVDFDSIYDTMAEVQDHFKLSSVLFGYSFTDYNVSFEEMVSIVTRSVHCTAYRQGNQLKLFFEKNEKIPTLLFNHRNKIPNTEKRTVIFGKHGDNDSVIIKYTDIEDQYELTVPEGVTPVNPKRIEVPGITTYENAYFHAWRLWRKMTYENTRVEFECTQEADALILGEKILVADNTRSETQDGEVISQNGLELTLSQEISFDVAKTYVIFLQHTDGTVESIGITAGSTSDKVILANAPKQSLALDPAYFARTTFIIAPDDDYGVREFLVTEKETNDNFTFRVTASNFDPRFYSRDQMQFYLPFGLFGYTDKGPFEVTITPQNTAALYNDATRGYVHSGSASDDEVNIGSVSAGASYTKMMWVYKTGTTEMHLMSSGTNEFFGFSNSTTLVGRHNNGADELSCTDNTFNNNWHHVAMTYDADTQIAKLYVDGVLKKTETSFAQRTLGSLYLCGNGDQTNALVGRTDDVVYYPYAMTNEEIYKNYTETL